MRALTDAEVSYEVAQMDDEAHWPLGTVLPVKHIHRHESAYCDPRGGIGLVVAGERTVYFLPLADLKSGPLAPQLADVAFEEFASTEHLVRSGWVGD